MKIRKFYEAEENKIADDVLNDIITKLSKIVSTMDQDKKEITSMRNTLSNFKSKSKTSNTQIDDSCANLETVDVKINDILSILDTTLSSLKDYNESGEKYLY